MTEKLYPCPSCHNGRNASGDICAPCGGSAAVSAPAPKAASKKSKKAA